MDVFGFILLRKSVIEKKNEPVCIFEEELFENEDLLEKKFRLDRVKMLKKPFLENANTQISRDELSCDKMEYLVSQDVRTTQSMCAYDAAEQESGLSEQVSAGMVRGGVVGSYATVRQDQDYIEYKNIFDRGVCEKQWCILRCVGQPSPNYRQT